jgi:ArsR family transcriptional regulator, arsenate/arsenite/antimonite-responsive transcriptional repressor
MVCSEGFVPGFLPRGFNPGKPARRLCMTAKMQEQQAPAVSISTSQRLAILKALGDRRRMEIVERLGACTGSAGCGDVRETLPISSATLSHHLKELETAGLIHIGREGKYARLSLRRDVWRAFLEDLQRL